MVARTSNPALYGKNVERRRETDEWTYVFQVDGVEYTGPTHTFDRGKAEDIAKLEKQKTKEQARQDREAGLGPMTFGAACDAWWNAEDTGSSNKESGLEYRLKWLRKHVGEETLLRDITPDVVTKIKKERAQCLRLAGKDHDGKQLYRPLTPAAVKATLVTLRTVVNHASKAEGAAVRMLDWTTWIKKDEEEHDIHIMHPSEQAAIWPHLSDEARELAEFNLETPKRINEILPLTWSNVNLADEFIRLKLKGKRKLYDDPIGPLEVARLQRLKAAKLHPTAVFTYVSERTREYNGAKHVKGQRRPMTYQKFYEAWTAACAKAGITDLNPHCLRHTGATRYYVATRDIYTVSKMLNHSSIDTTRKYYARHEPELVRQIKRELASGAVRVPAKSPAKLRVV